METTVGPRILGKICPFCLKEGKTIEAKVYLQIGSLLVWECPFCQKEFDNRHRGEG